MSKFDDEIAASVDEMLDVMGDSVFIRGIGYSVIVQDESFFDDAGQRRALAIDVKRQELQHFKRNDSIVLRGKPFTIGTVVNESLESPFITLELLNAKR